MLLCALVTARVMLKYFSPLISFTGTAVALLFVTGGTTKVLSYNSMPVLFLLLAAWLWLSAHDRNGRRQVLLACGAGLTAFIATACRLSLLPVVLLPLLTLAYDHYCGVRVSGRLRMAAAFFAAYLVGTATFFLATGAAGIAGDFITGLGETSAVPGHSSSSMLRNALLSGLFFLSGALPVLVPALLVKRGGIVKSLRRWSGTRTYAILAALLLCLLTGVLQWAGAFSEAADWLLNAKRHVLDVDPPYKLVGYGLAMGLAAGVMLVGVTSHIRHARAHGTDETAHGRYRLALLALSLPFLMILGTNNLPAWSVRYMSWLPIPVAAGLGWLWITENAGRTLNVRLASLARLGLVALLILCALYGLALNRLPYRSGPIGEQVAGLQTEKLQGILTTSDRARTVDFLVEAVKSNSRPGGRILAYENLPMLYFLTDRLPATNRSWVTENFHRSLRESILEDMIDRERVPEVVIRATYTTREQGWPAVRAPLEWDENEQETDPIDAYVREHYEVVDEIDGFQVMLPAE